MTKQQCQLCFESTWEKEFEFQDIFDEEYNLGLCSSCGVYSLNPLPTDAQLKQGYDESYYGVGQNKFNPIVEKVVDWFRARNATRFSKLVPENAVVLDIGCGNGSFLNSLSKKGNFELYGIEPEGKSGDRAAEFDQLKLHRGYLEMKTYETNKFDAIVLTHVFEHLPNPFQSLDVIKNICKPNGLLQIEVPNIDSWQYNFFKSNWFHLDPPRHLNMFPPQVLIARLQKEGWELTNESYFSPQFSPYGVQQSLLNMFCSKRDVLYEHLKGNEVYVSSYSTVSLVLQKLFHWVSFPFFVVLDAIASIFKRGATVKLTFVKTKN